MKSAELIREISEKLKTAGFDSADFEARQIAEYVSGEKNGTVMCEKEMADEQLEMAEEIVSRRLTHEPLQYIFGEWEFYGLPFKVGRGVLIPRPDTELAAETAIKLLKGKKNATLYDLCAGSGCIGTAVSKHTDAGVVFVEKSAQAFTYLEENIKLNGIAAKAVRGDVLECPPEHCYGSADMIVCNPPYIKSSVLHELSAEIAFEPVSALDGGEDGMIFYRFIARYWKKVLKPGGYLLFEIGFDQRSQVADIMTGEGFSGVTCLKDYGGNDRVVYGKVHEK